MKVGLDMDRDAAIQTLRRLVVKPGSPAMTFVAAAAEDSYDRLIFPSLEREIRNLLTDAANEAAIRNFALNLKPLLMQPPVKSFVTMGLDPGYSHGCKVAVVDATGKVLTPRSSIRRSASVKSARRSPSSPRSSANTTWRTSPSATARPAARPRRWPSS